MTYPSQYVIIAGVLIFPHYEGVNVFQIAHSFPGKRSRTAARPVLRVLAAGGLLVFLSGCSGPSFWAPVLQSNYIYPNSNVTERVVNLTGTGNEQHGVHAKGTATRTYVFFQIPSYNDVHQLQDAINTALVAGEGGVLVNGSQHMTSEGFPGLFTTVTVTVEGDVFKMDRFRRDLVPANTTTSR